MQACRLCSMQQSNTKVPQCRSCRDASHVIAGTTCRACLLVVITFCQDLFRTDI